MDLGPGIIREQAIESVVGVYPTVAKLRAADVETVKGFQYAEAASEAATPAAAASSATLGGPACILPAGVSPPGPSGALTTIEQPPPD